MLRHRILAFAVATAVSAPAFAQAPAVRLRVVSDADAEPLRRVKVVVTGRVDAPVFTDDGGQVELPRLTGPMELHVSKSGFAPQRLRLAARPAGPVGVRLVPAAVIIGRVVDSRGAPAVRVGVTIRRLDPATGASPSEAQVRTNDLGEFRLGNLVAGRYELYTERGGGQQAREPRSDTVTVRVEPGQTIDVGLAHPDPSIEFPFSEGGVVTGTLVDEHGEPAEGYRVTLRSLTETGPFHMGVSGVTDDLGRYRLFHVPPGRHLVSAITAAIPELAPSEAQTLLPVYYPGRLNPADATPLTIERSREIPGIDMVVTQARGARVFGTVALNGRQSMPVLLRPVAPSGTLVTDFRSITTAANGDFALTNVPPGTYSLKTLSPIVYDRPSTVTDFRFAALQIVVGVDDVGPISLTPTPTATLDGRLVLEGDRSGVTPNDFRLAILPVDRDHAPDPGMVSGSTRITREVDPDLDWTFRIAGLAGRTRFGLARAPQGWQLKAVRIGVIDAALEPVDFGSADDSRDDVEIVLTRTSGSISGRLADDRQSTEAYTVIAFSTDRDRWFDGSQWVRTTTSRSDGGFVLSGLPSGDYLLAAVEYSELDPTADEIVHPDGLARLAASAQRITIGDGEQRRIELRLVRTAR